MIHRLGYRIDDTWLIHYDERPATWAEADQVAGRRVDRPMLRKANPPRSCMKIEHLAKVIPGVSTRLGEMMAKEGLGIFQDAGLTLEQATPSVGITFTRRDGSEPLRITLSVEAVERGED